jgi:hypothetical protein
MVIEAILLGASDCGSGHENETDARVVVKVTGLAFVTPWFLGVDASMFVENSPNCGCGWDIVQLRVFTIPIQQRITKYKSLLQKVAADLGVPCVYAGAERWHKCRRSGLCIPAYPRISGIYRLAGGTSWYHDAAVLEVKAMAEADPSLRIEFAERVLKRHDMDYWALFLRHPRVAQEGALRSPHPDADFNIAP